MIIVDESGSITRNEKPWNRYFIISVIETQEPKNVIRYFRKAKENYIKHHPGKCKNMDITKEIKGSSMSCKMKSYIFSELRNHTDINFNYIIIDNWNLKPQLYEDPERCFNFIIQKYFSRLRGRKSDVVDILIDERNCTVKSVNSLSMYLRIALCLEKDIFKDISSCLYGNSKASDLIQVADLFANCLERACRSQALGQTNSGNIRSINITQTNHNMYFPYQFNEISFFS